MDSSRERATLHRLEVKYRRPESGSTLSDLVELTHSEFDDIRRLENECDESVATAVLFTIAQKKHEDAGWVVSEVCLPSGTRMEIEIVTDY